MNILFVTPFYTPQSGGVATYVEDMRRLLTARGHKIFVMCPGESDTIQPFLAASKVGVVKFNLRAPWIASVPVRGIVAFFTYLLPTLSQLRRFISDEKIQLISLEYPMTYMVYFYLIRKLLHVPIVVGLHGSDVLLLSTNDRLSQLIIRKLIKGADWVLAHSLSLLRDARHRISGLGVNLSYLHYGIECIRFRDATGDAGVSAAVLSGDYILTVANLYPRKGLDVLLRAIKILKDKGSAQRFVIIGEGPEEARLKGMAKDLGIEEMVEFLGDVKNYMVRIFFKQCLFFVLPSRVEPFGIVLLEAMTFQKAIVATSVGGIPEFVKNEHNGILVPAEDSVRLAEQIERLIHDEGLRKTLGTNGRKVVEEEYDYHILIEKYEALFQERIRRYSANSHA